MEIIPEFKDGVEWDKFIETHIGTDISEEDKKSLNQKKEEFEKKGILKLSAKNLEITINREILPNKKNKSLLVIFYFVQKKLDILNQALKDIMEGEKLVTTGFVNAAEIGINIDKSAIFQTKYKNEFDQIALERQNLKMLSARIYEIIQNQKLETLKQDL